MVAGQLIGPAVFINCQGQEIGANPGTGGQATAINESGQITAWYYGGDAFLWFDGGVTVIPATANVANIQPRAINAAGVVAGTAYFNGYSHGFMWDAGSMTDLGTLGGVLSQGWAIDGNGVVYGESAADGGPQGFAYDGGLNPLGNFYPYATNAAGQTVGNTFTAVGMHAAIGPPSFQDIGGFGGDAQATGISADGSIVVGWSHFGDGGNLTHAFVYQSGTMTDLNDLLPPDSGWELTYAQGITPTTKMIAGTGLVSGIQHAFIYQLP